MKFGSSELVFGEQPVTRHPVSSIRPNRDKDDGAISSSLSLSASLKLPILKVCSGHAAWVSPRKSADLVKRPAASAVQLVVHFNRHRGFELVSAHGIDTSAALDGGSNKVPS